MKKLLKVSLYWCVKVAAFKEILEYYGKNTSSLSFNILLDIVIGEANYVKHSEPFMPVRPGQNIRIKVMIEEKYFQIFQDKTFEDFAAENIHKNFISCNFQANELDNIINDL